MSEVIVVQEEQLRASGQCAVAQVTHISHTVTGALLTSPVSQASSTAARSATGTGPDPDARRSRTCRLTRDRNERTPLVAQARHALPHQQDYMLPSDAPDAQDAMDTHHRIRLSGRFVTCSDAFDAPTKATDTAASGRTMPQ